jgi:hypothetical protein
MVVGEVAVVDQRLVHAHERVRAAGVPHAALGGVALVGDPDVGFEVLELVVLDVLLGVAHQLEHQLVAAVREHEGALFAERGVQVSLRRKELRHTNSSSSSRGASVRPFDSAKAASTSGLTRTA